MESASLAASEIELRAEPTYELAVVDKTADHSSGNRHVLYPQVVSCDFTVSSAAETAKAGKMVHVKIGPQHFDLLKLLGEGAFGKVLLVQNRLDHKVHAMKVISKTLLRKKNNVQYMKSEREILTKLHHPFLVHLHFAFQSSSKLFLVMEFLAGGELFLHLRRRGLILEKDVQFYLAEVILALEFLHGHHIIHRDLKPENILLRGDGHICVTDFGLAKEIGDGVTTRTLCGTSEYMAPEMLTRAGYGKAVDYWALGALACEMLTSKPPFTAKSQKELDRKILSEKLSLPSFLSAPCVSLLRGLLDRDASKRLGCSKSSMFSIGGVHALKMHAFFEGLNWQDVENLQLIPPIDIQLGSEMVTQNALDTQYFSQEFTKQVISRSILEDTLASSGATPVIRSPRSTSPPSARPDGSANDFDEFSGFEYTSGQFLCTAEEIEKFESLLLNKTQKAEKKNKLKQKKELTRQQEELIRKEKEQKEREELTRKLAEEQQRREREDRIRSIQLHNEKVKQFEDNVANLQKRVKNVKKKIKDIEDLQNRVAAGLKPDSDQKTKLSKMPGLLAELEELMAEEKLLMSKDPGPLQTLEGHGDGVAISKNGHADIVPALSSCSLTTANSEQPAPASNILGAGAASVPARTWSALCKPSLPTSTAASPAVGASNAIAALVETKDNKAAPEPGLKPAVTVAKKEVDEEWAVVTKPKGKKKL
eukprot:scaffold1623_cov165-Ochromonas_danica.AAC.11